MSYAIKKELLYSETLMFKILMTACYSSFKEYLDSLSMSYKRVKKMNEIKKYSWNV